MKKIASSFIVIVIIMVFFVSSVSADVFRDLDDINYTFSTASTYRGVFNIASGDGDPWDTWGFNPGTDVVEYVYIMFTFSLYSPSFHSGMPVDVGWTGFGLTHTIPNQSEVSIFSVDITEADHPGSWEALSTTGILDYDVGTYGLPGPHPTLLSAKLEVGTSKEPATSVPEPAVMVLLGIGLLGLAESKRRVKSL